MAGGDFTPVCRSQSAHTQVKLLQHCRAVQSHRIPVVFEGMEPAVSCSRQFFQATHCQVYCPGIKMDFKRCRDFQGYSEVGPECTGSRHRYLPLCLSFLLSAVAGVVGTDSFLGQGMLPSSPACSSKAGPHGQIAATWKHRGFLH